MLAPSRAETAACVVVVAVGLLSLACAGGPKPARLPATAVAALETELARHPDDPAANLRLGKAYYAAGQFAQARHALGTTLRLQPRNAEAQVYLGLSYEG